jgi:hypothetical protein
MKEERIFFFLEFGALYHFFVSQMREERILKRKVMS